MILLVSLISVAWFVAFITDGVSFKQSLVGVIASWIALFFGALVVLLKSLFFALIVFGVAFLVTGDVEGSRMWAISFIVAVVGLWLGYSVIYVIPVKAPAKLRS